MACGFVIKKRSRARHTGLGYWRMTSEKFSDHIHVANIRAFYGMRQKVFYENLQETVSTALCLADLLSKYPCRHFLLGQIFFNAFLCRVVSVALTQTFILQKDRLPM